MRYRPITRNREFGRAYARGRSYVHPKLVLYVNKNRLGHTRVGLTATKKVGGAVQRNRARRVMRAALYETLPYNVGGWDLVFRSQKCGAISGKMKFFGSITADIAPLSPIEKRTNCLNWCASFVSFCTARVWWNDRPAAGGAHPLL